MCHNYFNESDVQAFTMLMHNGKLSSHRIMLAEEAIDTQVRLSSRRTKLGLATMASHVQSWAPATKCRDGRVTCSLSLGKSQDVTCIGTWGEVRVQKLEPRARVPRYTKRVSYMRYLPPLPVSISDSLLGATSHLSSDVV